MKHHGKDNIRIVLGIDPGSIVCGYGVIKTEVSGQNSRLRRVAGETDFRQKQSGIRLSGSGSCGYVASGRIMLSSKQPLHVRLRELYDSLTEVIREYSPDEVSVEKVFFAKSVRAALTLGHARGVALLAASSCGLPVYEYSALEVKKSVVGYGRAEKDQVIGMVSRILNLGHKLSRDSADALALALCHTNTLRIGNR